MQGHRKAAAEGKNQIAHTPAAPKSHVWRQYWKWCPNTLLGGQTHRFDNAATIQPSIHHSRVPSAAPAVITDRISKWKAASASRVLTPPFPTPPNTTTGPSRRQPSLPNAIASGRRATRRCPAWWVSVGAAGASTRVNGTASQPQQAFDRSIETMERLQRRWLRPQPRLGPGRLATTLRLGLGLAALVAGTASALIGRRPAPSPMGGAAGPHPLLARALQQAGRQHLPVAASSSATAAGGGSGARAIWMTALGPERPKGQVRKEEPEPQAAGSAWYQPRLLVEAAAAPPRTTLQRCVGFGARERCGCFSPHEEP